MYTAIGNAPWPIGLTMVSSFANNPILSVTLFGVVVDYTAHPLMPKCP